MTKRLFLRLVIGMVVFGFLVNLFWENLQAPFYAGYRSFTQHFWLCFRAAIGDVIIFLFLYFLMALCRRDVYWIRKVTVVDMVVLLGVGLVLGVANELLALEFGRWWYTPTMPLVPWYHVGVWPVVQLMVLPLVTFFLVRKVVWKT